MLHRNKKNEKKCYAEIKKLKMVYHFYNTKGVPQKIIPLKFNGWRIKNPKYLGDGCNKNILKHLGDGCIKNPKHLGDGRNKNILKIKVPGRNKKYP